MDRRVYTTTSFPILYNTFYPPDKHAYIRLIGFFVERIEKFKHDFTNVLSARANRRVISSPQFSKDVPLPSSTAIHAEGYDALGFLFTGSGEKGFPCRNPCAPFQLTRGDKSWKRSDSTRLQKGYRPSFVNKTIREYRGGRRPFLKDFRRKKSREYPGEEARELITNFNGS